MRHALFLICLAALLPARARAQQGNEGLLCEPEPDELAPGRYLRALSLDLTGELPEPDAVADVEARGGVSPEDVDRMLATPGFLARAVRHHDALLWNSLRNLQPLAASQGLRSDANGPFYRRTVSPLFRGIAIGCLDEPATFDQAGQPVTRLVDGARREGYVLVAPYWAPETTVRICAFDAQATVVTSQGTDCGTTRAAQDTECGCGPGLRFCSLDSTRLAIVDAFAESQRRLVGAVIGEGGPYTDLFTTRRAFVNGPLVHFWRYQSRLPATVIFEPFPLDVEHLPDLPFSARDTWVEIELPLGHSGLLTQPAYLLRFQTNRARPNRFYDAFLCQPFQPPAGGLPAASADCSREPDLQQRCGCKYCHALLEPAGAHWGRFAEQGASWLSPERFPPVREDCVTCATTGQTCSDECRRFYVMTALTDAERPWLGTLKAYQFRREDHVRHVENGPRLLALSAVADDRLPRCVARRAAEWLLGRPLDMALEAEDTWLSGLSRRFVAGGYRFDALVREIVTSPVYRRVR